MAERKSQSEAHLFFTLLFAITWWSQSWYAKQNNIRDDRLPRYGLIHAGCERILLE